jgi:hypothetical protein
MQYWLHGSWSEPNHIAPAGVSELGFRKCCQSCHPLLAVCRPGSWRHEFGRDNLKQAGLCALARQRSCAQIDQPRV